MKAPQQSEDEPLDTEEFAEEEPLCMEALAGQISMSQIELYETTRQLRISIRWKNQLLRSILSIVGSFSILVFAQASAGHLGVIPGREEVSWIGFVVCSILTVATGYLTMAVWINRTFLQVDDLTVIVSLKPLPLPWFGKRVARQDIRQVYVQEIRNSSSASSGRVMSYEVWILSPDGHRVQLMDVGRATGQRWGDQTKLDAKFIEAKIEERLSIVESPVEQERVERFHGGGVDGGGGP